MTFTASNGYTFDGVLVRNRAGEQRHSLGKYTLDALREYFEYHKPWHDAKDNEVWVLTINGKEEPAMLYRAGEFETTKGTYRVSASGITAGRKIWPTEGES